MTKKSPPVNVGIDVGKARLDVYILERDRAICAANDVAAFKDMLGAPISHFSLSRKSSDHFAGFGRYAVTKRAGLEWPYGMPHTT